MVPFTLTVSGFLVLLILATTATCSITIFATIAHFLSKRMKKDVLTTPLGLVLMMTCYGSAFYATYELSVGALPLSFPLRSAAGAALVCAAGIGMYVLKTQHLMVYSILELIFATAVAAHTINGLSDNVAPIQMLGLLTAAYLVIRGIDNFKKGWEEFLKACMRGKTAQAPPSGTLA